MQRIKTDLTHYNFFCPVTGAQITDAEQFNPSPAQLFCYIDEGVFEYVHKNICPLLEEIGVDTTADVIEADWDTFKILIERLESPSLVLFEFTDCGMACGPVSLTSFHCIDLSYDLE